PGILAFGLILLSPRGTVAQQPESGRHTPHSAAAQSPFAEAESLLRAGHTDEARNEVEKQLKQSPSSAEGYSLLGIIYTSQKNYDEAVEAFQHALKLAPRSTKAHNNLANLYVAQGMLDLAEKEFREVLRLDPANRDGNYNLGLLLMAEGSPATAIPHFRLVRPLNMETRFNLTRAYL